MDENIELLNNAGVPIEQIVAHEKILQRSKQQFISKLELENALLKFENRITAQDTQIEKQNTKIAELKSWIKGGVISILLAIIALFFRTHILKLFS